MSGTSLFDLHRLVWTALLAATIGASAYLIVPVGPVPVSMQPLFVFLAGYILGPRYGAMAVALYVLAGTIGLPVFAGGKSGLGHLFGPTGGYLFGFIGTAFLTGYARKKDRPIPWIEGLACGGAGLLFVYLVGAVWLKLALSMPWRNAFMAGVAPFIPWDAVKAVAALACTRYLSRFNLLPGQR